MAIPTQVQVPETNTPPPAAIAVANKNPLRSNLHPQIIPFILHSCCRYHHLDADIGVITTGNTTGVDTDANTHSKALDSILC